MDFHSKYKAEKDETLVKMAQQGDDEAADFLLQKYKESVRGKCHLYFIAGADNDDIIQEGMIGLFKAIQGYSPDREASFRTFAEICINRQILTAIKRAGRQKHIPLNTSVSIHNPLDGKLSKTKLEDTLPANDDLNPEAMLLLKEELDYIETNGDKIFSDLELLVWKEYRLGKTYTQIAESMGKTAKSIDNAIQRMKKKLEQHLNST